VDSRWVERAAALGWDALALFGCCRHCPLDRPGGAGLLWLINGGRLVELLETGPLLSWRRMGRNAFLTVGTFVVAGSSLRPPKGGSHLSARAPICWGHLSNGT